MKKAISLVLVLALGMLVGVANADFTFGEPTNLGPMINSPSHGDCPTYISVDGLELYFSSTRPGGYGSDDIWVTRRLAKNDPWGEPVNLGLAVNSSGSDFGLSISPDGQTLYFDSEHPGGYGGSDLYVATRQSKHYNWGSPVNLGSLVNNPAHECCPSISVDGLELYFSDWTPEGARPGGYGWSDIWISTRPTKEAPWGEPENLGPPVNTGQPEAVAYISADGLELYFGSYNRPGGYGHLSPRS